jgi:hypothetical protein
MEIQQEVVETTPLSRLKPGEAFKDRGHHWMKTTDETDGMLILVVNLRSGELDSMPLDHEVVRLPLARVVYGDPRNR